MEDAVTPDFVRLAIAEKIVLSRNTFIFIPSLMEAFPAFFIFFAR
jgi:hypothetical protein